MFLYGSFLFTVHPRRRQAAPVNQRRGNWVRGGDLNPVLIVTNDASCRYSTPGFKLWVAIHALKWNEF